MIKQLVKRLLFALSPKWATAFFSARARARSHRVVREWGCLEINEKLIKHLGAIAQEGPFHGLILSPMTRAEHLGPYLLGVHESELDRAWEVVFRGSFSQIVDVGSSFGYYSVGLAKRFSRTDVVAFDTDWWAREATQEMASANLVANVEVLGFCDADWLCKQLREGAFIISDCEGYESELFCSKPIPLLATATLIIEMHDDSSPGVSDRIRCLLGPTHQIYEIASDSGRRESTRDLGFLTVQERKLAMHEVRLPQVWFLCLPKSGPNQALQPAAARLLGSAQHSASSAGLGG